MSGAMTARVGIRNPAAGGAAITLQGGTIVRSPAGNVPLVLLDRNGDERQISNSGTATSVWATPASSTVGDGYEVRATVISGVLYGTADVWTRINSTQSWYAEQGGEFGGDGSCTFTLEIRPFGGGAVLDSDSYTLQNTA